MGSNRISWGEIYKRLTDAPPGRLYGIPRGGAIVAGLTGRAVDEVDDADWLVDDVIDSRTTARSWSERADKPVWALFDKQRDGFTDRYLVMPWEATDTGSSQRVRLERIGHELLEALGYDVNAEGIRDTPSRWARWWQEFLSPEVHPRLDSAFDLAESGQMVVVSGIRVWSICEHHLMPFSADVSIGYVPHGRVLGLSKFARLSQLAAHRLQLQERLAAEIADAACQLTSSPDVGVLIVGRHLCMESRGVRTPALATSLVTRGMFDDDSSLRSEFIALHAVATRRSGSFIEDL